MRTRPGHLLGLSAIARGAAAGVVLTLLALATLGCDPSFNQRLVVREQALESASPARQERLMALTEVVDEFATANGFEREQQAETGEVHRVWTRSTRPGSGAYTHMSIAVVGDGRHDPWVRMSESLARRENPWMRDTRLRLSERLKERFGDDAVEVKR